jgi:hypothetical protein
MNIDNRFLSRARLVCYGPSQLPGVGDGAGDGSGEPKTFTQEDLNKILAEDRRKHQAQVVKIQSTLEETLQSKNLAAQEKESLAQQLEEVKRANETAAQTLAREKKEAETALAKKVAEAGKEAEKFKKMFQQQLVESELTRAVSDPDVFNPDQLKQLIRGSGVELEQIRDEATGQMTDNMRVVVVMEDRDAEGKPIRTKTDPVSAVKRMKVLSAVYGNQFRSGVVSGIGSGSAVGGGYGPGGTGIDPKNLTAEQYMAVRAKNPEALGLRRKKHGQPSGIAK